MPGVCLLLITEAPSKPFQNEPASADPSPAVADNYFQLPSGGPFAFPTDIRVTSILGDTVRGQPLPASIAARCDRVPPGTHRTKNLHAARSLPAVQYCLESNCCKILRRHDTNEQPSQHRPHHRRSAVSPAPGVRHCWQVGVSTRPLCKHLHGVQQITCEVALVLHT
jgi:hypothetical protein